MDKTAVGKLCLIIGLALMVGITSYYYLSFNKINKKLNEVQETVIEDSNTVAEIVNFFNANLNAEVEQ